MGIELEGADQVTRALQSLQDAANDLYPAQQTAADLLLARADQTVPRATGTLAASGHTLVTADDATVVYDATYAGYVHARQPWLTEVFNDTRDAVLAVFVDYLQDAITT